MSTEVDQEKTGQVPASPMAARFAPDPVSPGSERPRSFFGRNSASGQDIEDSEEEKGKPTRWSMGVLNDPHTHEVPGK